MLLVGAAIMAVFLPMIPPSSGTELVEILQQGSTVVLVGESGTIAFELTDDEIAGASYSSDNPFDFFSLVADPSQISRLEILPYGTGTVCSVVKSGSTDTPAGKASFCIALASRTGIPLYVAEDLLVLNPDLSRNL